MHISSALGTLITTSAFVSGCLAHPSHNLRAPVVRQHRRALADSIAAISQSNNTLDASALSNSLVSTSTKAAGLAPLLDDQVLAKIRQNAIDHDQDSWVAGQLSQALLDLDYVGLSVFSEGYVSNIKKETLMPDEVIDIAWSWKSKLHDDSQLLCLEGAVGDAASLGIAFVVSGYTAWEQRDRYLEFASRQVDYLLNVSPRMENLAISHRPITEPAQLWADNVAMTPSFLSFSGVMNDNAALAKEGYEQCRLYREILRDQATGFWHHVLGGNWHDVNFWSTGQGWAAMGMTRVYATLKNSPLVDELEVECENLMNWSNEILKISFAQMDQATGLLPNEYNNDGPTFDDTASSALLAAVAYRLAEFGVLQDQDNMLAQAEKIRAGIYAKIDVSTGWMNSATDPLLFYQPINKSPESLVFILFLEAAVRDYALKTNNL